MIGVVAFAFKLSIVQSRTPFRASTFPLEAENDTRDTVSLCSLPNSRGYSDLRSKCRSASSSASELVIGGAGDWRGWRKAFTLNRPTLDRGHLALFLSLV